MWMSWRGLLVSVPPSDLAFSERQKRGSDTDTQTEGCSGAEVASICQDAALSAMNQDIDAPFVCHCAQRS